MKLLTTGATQLDGPGRLLTTRETVLEDKRTCLGGANNSAGGTRKVVYYMGISAGGAREVGNKRRNNARKARNFDNMINSIAGAIDAGNNRRNSIGVAMGIAFFISLYNGKPNEALDALRYMRFCEQVSCQTVHGQPQDWKGCASRLAPKEF